MYLLMRPLNHFTSAEQGAFRFTALDFSGDNVIVNGRVLYLRDIRLFVETLIEEIRAQIQTDLFFGLDLVDMNWSPGVVYEQPRNITVGYSCFSDPHNTFARHKEDLLKAVLTHPRLRGHFHFINQQGHVVWKAATCFAYMDTCHEIEMKLFAGTQTSVGEPARGTEIASNVIENVEGGTLRNILNLFQYFTMMGTFNKTSHAKESDITMMRVPHPEIGRLWMLYLTFVRPLLVVWQHHFQGRKAAARARSHLFFGPHRPVVSSELSRSLSFHTHRILNNKISMAVWRHIATWFLNHHIVHFQDHLSLTNRSALALQSGHSEGTHRLYAGDARLPANIDFHVFFETMRTSGRWHSLLGLKSDLLRDMNPHTTPASHLGGDEGTIPEYRVIKHDPPFSSATLIAEAVKKSILPEFLRLTSQTRASDLACLLDAIGVDVQSPVSRPLGGQVTHILHPSRLRDLRRFLVDDHATFRHADQALATELIATKTVSLLIIGPTGMSISSFLTRGCLEQFNRFWQNPTSSLKRGILRWWQFNNSDITSFGDARGVQGSCKEA